MKHLLSCKDTMCFEPRSAVTGIDTMFEQRSIVDEFRAYGKRYRRA